MQPARNVHRLHGNQYGEHACMDESFYELAVIHGAHAGNESQQGRQNRASPTNGSDGNWHRATHAMREAVLAVDNAMNRALAVRAHRLAAGPAESRRLRILMNRAVHISLLMG